jgi:type IV pilus assembly protein PilY1
MGFIPGTPAIVDRDNDGFIDTAYVGDLSGNLWKFTFCPFDPGEAACGTSNWQAMILYAPGVNKLPTFNSPAVAKDQNYYWVFWGTGDKANPNNAGLQNKFLAIRDQNPTSAYAPSNLQDLTNPNTTFNGTTYNGWYINLSGQERVLSDAAVFGGIALFTSYTPSTENPCGATGSAALYGIAMMPIAIGEGTYDPGEGVFSWSLNPRKVPLGTGVPSAPIISLKPVQVKGGVPDVYITVSGGGGTSADIKSSADIIPAEQINPLKGSEPIPSIIHWRDLRVQP